jgi:hypothetical protein
MKQIELAILNFLGIISVFYSSPYSSFFLSVHYLLLQNMWSFLNQMKGKHVVLKTPFRDI